MKSGQSRYYQELAREDYYLQGGEPPGVWLGRGASLLGCASFVTAEELSAFFGGFSVNGKPLVQNAGKPSRQCGWDLTFSAPKSVSVLWSQLDDAGQERLRNAQALAVRRTIDYLEKHCALSRIGRAGGGHVRAGLIVATFEHSTSRALDPQIHTHCLVINLGVDDLGQVRSILSKPFYEAKMLAGAFYRAELASLLCQTLGVTTERPVQQSGGRASWFEISGVPMNVMSHFSKRRAAIEKELSDRGLESASAASFAALSTRDAKSLVPPRKDLHARWKEEGLMHGFSAELLGSILSPGRTSVEAKKQSALLRKVLATAIEEITFGENSFTQNEFLRRSLEASQEFGLPASVVVDGVEKSLAANEFFVSLGVRNGAEHFTTKDVLADEQQFFRAVEGLRASPFRPVKEKHVTAAAARLRGDPNNWHRLDSEQREALQYVTRGGGAIKVVSGLAGAGKTDMLAAAREAFESDGYHVIGTALSSVAARNLQESTGIASETVRKREWQLRTPKTREVLEHHAWQLVRAAAGKATWSLPRLDIDSKTVLVIDEAGMLGTRDFARLARAVVAGGGAIVAVGDDKQLPSIERGGAFRHLIDTIGGAKLTEIRRQKDLADREAVKSVVAGDANAALQHYAKKGQFSVEATPDGCEQKLIADWSRHGGAARPGEHRIFAATRSEVSRLNAAAQQERLQRGHLAAGGVTHGGGAFYVGDRVRFNVADKTRGIRKGESGTVVACREGVTGKYLAVARSEQVASWSEHAVETLRHHGTQLVNAALGRATTPLSPRHDIVLVPLETRMPFVKPQGGISLDYVMTTHLGQGQTVKNAYVLLGGDMTDRELSYVQMSRHKETLRLYATERQAGRELAELARRHQPGLAAPTAVLPETSTLLARMKQSHEKELASTQSNHPTEITYAYD